MSDRSALPRGSLTPNSAVRETGTIVPAHAIPVSTIQPLTIRRKLAALDSGDGAGGVSPRCSERTAAARVTRPMPSGMSASSQSQCPGTSARPRPAASATPSRTAKPAYCPAQISRRRGRPVAREADKLEIVKQAAKSQLSYFKLAVLGGRRSKE